MALSEIIFLAPLPAFKKRARLTKMVKHLRARGLPVMLLGWERLPREIEAFRFDDPDVIERAILRGGGYASLKARLMYPIWMFVVFWTVVRLGKNQTLFCLGWETAFPARLAAAFTKARIIFDDADRISMTLRLPGLAHSCLEVLEHWTSREVAFHLIPSFSRYSWRHRAMLPLANAPLLEDVERAKTLFPKRPKADLVLYANGWIGETRGAPIFLQALSLARSRGLDISLVIAGHITGESANNLLEHPSTIFLGEISQQQALAWYAASDILLTYYDPAIAINRKAESNKWGDAVTVGVPFIVNSEVETAKAFVDAGAAWSVPYSDAKALVDLLATIIAEPEKVREAQTNLQLFGSDYPTFDDAFSRIVDRLF